MLHADPRCSKVVARRCIACSNIRCETVTVHVQVISYACATVQWVQCKPSLESYAREGDTPPYTNSLLSQLLDPALEQNVNGSIAFMDIIKVRNPLAESGVHAHGLTIVVRWSCHLWPARTCASLCNALSVRLSEKVIAICVPYSNHAALDIMCESSNTRVPSVRFDSLSLLTCCAESGSRGLDGVPSSL